MLFQRLRRYAVVFFALAALSLTLIKPAVSASASPNSSASVVELRIDGEIEPGLAEYIVRGINEANADRASLILITMNTPGGLDTSMREIIQAILASKVPVCAYVAPTGSRAASAGFFILLSADIAAMAPGTDTGAASPILALGGQPVQIDDTLHKKIVNEATAYLRSYVTQRGRNAELAATAVTDAKAFSEKEALDGKLVDLVAANREDLLAKLNGRSVTRLDGTKLQLALSQPVVVPHEMTGREKFLTRIVQPDVFFILLIVGVLGLYVEFSHPGMFAPGVIGGIALVLALFAMHMLPVNFTGLLLIIVAFMLIRSPFTGMGVSLSTALGVALPFAVIIVILMRLVLRSRNWKQTTGKEELVGEEAEVTETVEAGNAAGMVFVHGELWRAAAPAGVSIPKGARVRVRKVKGLTLEVEPAHAPHPAHSHETLEGRQ